ncbi:V-type immunoglobulin domain-containing suppressor of T-cell activation [Halichoeres trimaculatus]|uniref:V-type immunoglobulin domain-containing suppressor of T-cell activation n=1 Tax=Halichoeres trimaculatus TaxID=147232 RepID=UPI003D9E71AE
MESRLACQSGLRGKSFVIWICSVLLFAARAGGVTSHTPPTLGVSAPHLYYNCPEGATAKLLCSQRGAALYPKDILKHSWLFTPHADQHCSGRAGPRHTIVGAHSSANHSLPVGLSFGSSEHDFWVLLKNVTGADQGRYCCLVLDIQVAQKHANLVQKTHSHIVLQVSPRRNGSQECTVWDPNPPGGVASLIVAGSACMIALFALPLILLLVYKQRQNSRASRRAQELVRMDSEAQGHENPVFFHGSPQIKTRTVSQIMTRQSSETGRHLLSDPGTPLSPPAHGDVFFPIEDTILESPELVQV